MRFLFLIILALEFGTIAAFGVDFVEDVRPIFREHCYECHGPDTQKSGLRLDVKEAAFKGGSGHAPDIIPGDPHSSPLIHFIIGDDAELQMPPKGPPLSDREIETLTAWIEQGAVWPDGADDGKLDDPSDHWSFEPVVRPDPPATKSPDWARNEIDHFVLNRLEEAGLSPSHETDRATWLRRVTFDLTGLPPTTEEFEDFLDDESGEAYASVVDSLLASPRYGERWAQHWLDVVRYADTHGFEVNTERANAWPYRDYVIEAFNRDLPYDRFVREQLAGDALGENRATGFLVTSAVLLPGQIGKDDESKRLARQDELTEIVTNTGEAFLGLSIGCARCHDHKFDAISAEDFYSMQAFFSGVQFGERPDTNPIRKEDREKLRSEIERLEKRVAQFSPVIGSERPRPPVSAARNTERFRPIKAKKVRLTIHSTISNNKREPFIDELEIYNREGENVALASRGAISHDSGSSGKTLSLINDGVHGNESCWRAKEKGEGWVQIEFPEEMEIDRIVWGRDRTGRYKDRLALEYEFRITDGAGNHQVLSASDSRLAYTGEPDLIAGIDVSTLNSNEKAELEMLRKELEPLSARYARIGADPMLYAGRFTEPEPIHLLRRGDPEQPLTPVVPAVLSAIGDDRLSGDAPEQKRRIALGDWIASPDHPLTARVMVNRIWQWHFGMGLVETPNDFGRAGARPSHPELLDWLASEFVRSGWSIKHLHRLIVLSRTYLQASEVRPGAATVDGDVRLLWRFPSRRLEAEAIRDSILSVSGRLNLETGGSGFDLFNKRGGTAGVEPIEESSEKNRRRMIYAHKIRMEREAVFGAFDCPDAGQSMPRRRQSTTPIQALNLFNSQFTHDESVALAERFDAEGPDTPEERVRLAWMLAYSREPDPEEIADATKVAAFHGWPTLFRALFNSNEFVFLP